MTENDRETFELYGPENMQDESDAMIADLVHGARDSVAETLARIANLGYLSALEDMRKGVLALACNLHNGHPAVTGVLAAEEKITLVYSELYAFMWPEAPRFGAEKET